MHTRSLRGNKLWVCGGQTLSTARTFQLHINYVAGGGGGGGGENVEEAAATDEHAQ